MKDKASELSEDDLKTLKAYKLSLDQATKFIPTWVKIAVAISLGLGTMIGWKRIVITVGEKIGKTHLTYACARGCTSVVLSFIGTFPIHRLSKACCSH
jgi:inorganic phosphate transporter, PiT family